MLLTKFMQATLLYGLPLGSPPGTQFTYIYFNLLIFLLCLKLSQIFGFLNHKIEIIIF